MIPMLTLRLPWQRKRPTTSPLADKEPPAATPAPVAPSWAHRPPEPFEWSDRCGWCKGPIPAASPDPEFCSPRHASDWLLETNGPTYGPGLPPVQGCDVPPSGPELRLVPEAPSEPAWMTQIDAWEKAKAQRLIADRKSPTGEEKAA